MINLPILERKLNYKKLNKINLHTPEISKQSATIAKIYKVRKILKKFQINFAKKHKNCFITFVNLVLYFIWLRNTLR